MVSRFDCPSGQLKLRGLLAKPRRAFWVALAIALGVHLGMAQLRVSHQGRRVTKPLTTKFLKREPRLAKPLELKKRPKPKPRPMKRKVVAVKAKVSRRDILQSTAPALKVLDSLAKPKGGVVRTVSFEPARFEGYCGSTVIEGSKEPEQKTDMALEMLDVDALDTGKYHAMVIQDPHDKRKIRGFFHVVIVISRQLQRMDDNPTPIHNLVRWMNRLTDVKTDIMGSYTLGDDRMFRVPIIFIGTNKPFHLYPNEAVKLGKYMTSGGFVFADDSNCVDLAVDQTLKAMFADAFSAVGLRKGIDWEMRPLPNSHPIYHCYFDFDGPPIGRETYRMKANVGDRHFDLRVKRYLHGIFLADGQLVGIFTEKDYTCCWQLEWPRVIQLGINVIIYSLTREGSITHRVMSSID